MTLFKKNVCVEVSLLPNIQARKAALVRNYFSRRNYFGLKVQSRLICKFTFAFIALLRLGKIQRLWELVSEFTSLITVWTSVSERLKSWKRQSEVCMWFFGWLSKRMETECDPIYVLMPNCASHWKVNYRLYQHHLVSSNFLSEVSLSESCVSSLLKVTHRSTIKPFPFKLPG